MKFLQNFTDRDSNRGKISPYHNYNDAGNADILCQCCGGYLFTNEEAFRKYNAGLQFLMNPSEETKAHTHVGFEQDVVKLDDGSELLIRRRVVTGSKYVEIPYGNP